MENDRDVQRVLVLLGRRHGQCGLSRHPVNTRHLAFRPNRFRGNGKGWPFAFLGLAHYCMRERKGNPVVRQTTAESRFARSLVPVTLVDQLS